MMHILVYCESEILVNLILNELASLKLKVTIAHEQEGALALLATQRFGAVVANLRPLGRGGSSDIGLFRYITAHFPGTLTFAVPDLPDEKNRPALLADLEKAMIRSGGSATIDLHQKAGRLGDCLKNMLLLPHGTENATLDVEHLENLDSFMKRGTLTSFYQPIIDLQGSRIMVACEALSRAKTKNLLGNPALLFSYSAQKNYFSEIDSACTKSALTLGKDLPGDIDLFINVQPRSLTDPSFAENLWATVNSNDRTPSTVVVELTEQREVLNHKMFLAGLHTLKDMGFRIAIDDFGEGNSNLEMVILTAPDIIKISGRICKHVTKVKIAAAMISTITKMCQNEGLISMAEFIEGEEEASLLTDLGVDLGQGWHLGKPVPAGELCHSP